MYSFAGSNAIVSTERVCQAAALIGVRRSFEKAKNSGDTQKI